VSIRLDHVVLWVDDPAASLEFYGRVVGLAAVRAEEFRAGKAPFPSVRITESTIIDLMPRSAAPWAPTADAAAGNAGHPINHLCLAMPRADFEALRGRLERSGTPIPTTLERSFGARGLAPETFYFQDPDRNVIEARYYDT
jgi:glyoxylase I family protein